MTRVQAARRSNPGRKFNKVPPEPSLAAGHCNCSISATLLLQLSVRRPMVALDVDYQPTGYTVESIHALWYGAGIREHGI